MCKLLDTGLGNNFFFLFDSKCKHNRRRQWHPTPVLLPGKSHGRRSLVGCSPWGREESDTTEQLHFHFSLSCIAEGNGNPLQCSCLENPRDRGAWWAPVYGVAQSQTRLKWLSSSSSSRSSSKHNRSKKRETRLHQITKLCTAKKTIKKWKDNLQFQRIIYKSHIHKGLIYKIYKELIQINGKRNKQSDWVKNG